MKYDNFINNFLAEDELTGGLADKYTPEAIAKKHNVPVEDILFQIAKGIKIEYEHTNDKEVAREISMDHLVEIPDYYDRLTDMEEEADTERPKEEMVSMDVVGGSPSSGTGIAPQDNIDYAKGDARVPKSLFNTKSKKKKKKKKINIQRRPKTGM